MLLALGLGLAARPIIAAAQPKDPRISDLIRGQHIADASPPLDRPPLRPAADASHMRDEDAVLGVALAGGARAYPWWVVKNHHVVNDAIAGVPIVVAFCEQCTGAAAFRRTVGGRVLSFGVAGVHNGTIILRDRETRTLWAPFNGRALEGSLAGRKLDRVPLALTRWDVWAARHPRGDVVWSRPEGRQGHGSWYEPGKWGVVSEMAETLSAWDPRLPENALVYGVEDGASARSYLLSALRARGSVLNDQLAERPVVVVAQGPLEVGAYDRRSRGRVLTFRPSPGLQAVMNDEQTGSDWSGEGVAVGGPLQGERLQALDGYLVEWHVWSAYHPAAELIGEPAAPTPSAGLTFPPLILQELRGGRRALSLPGRLNLIVVWAAWCPPCRIELPRLQRLAESRSAQGLAIVGIALHLPDDEGEKAVVERFVARERLAFPTFLVDEAGYDRLESLSRSAGRPGLLLPTVFAVDGEGRVLSVLTGKEVEALPEAVDALLRPRGVDAPR